MLLFSSQIYLKAIFLLQEVFYTVHNPIEMKQPRGRNKGKFFGQT